MALQQSENKQVDGSFCSEFDSDLFKAIAIAQTLRNESSHKPGVGGGISGPRVTCAPPHRF